jgi:hypothetical protein
LWGGGCGGMENGEGAPEQGASQPGSTSSPRLALAPSLVASAAHAWHAAVTRGLEDWRTGGLTD